ncbi:MAG: ZPR1 zinc finger domain-containing protein [Methanobacteriota archaeon]
MKDRLDAKCPACGRATLQIRSFTHEVPYFGEALETLLLCVDCGYRHVDFTILEQREPMRYALACRGRDDFGVRVIRSNTGTFQVPELGFTAEPTQLSESFVSNVEGVLERVKKAFETALAGAEDEPQAQEIRLRLARLDRMLLGEDEFTLVLEDPLGNSMIVSDKAERRKLTDEEVRRLEDGLPVLDLKDLQ